MWNQVNVLDCISDQLTPNNLVSVLEISVDSSV